MSNSRFLPNTEVDDETISIVELSKAIALVALDYNKDYLWWKSWFTSNGYEIEEPAADGYPETCHIIDKNMEAIVDMWPFKLENSVLLINRNGDYSNSHRCLNEVRIVEFQGVKIRIENPQRVLDQKLKETKGAENLRPQDIHDFKILNRGF